MPDFGFVGPAYEAASIYQDDQQAVNWYCEVAPTHKSLNPNISPDQRGVIALYPTPGLLLRLNLAVGAPVRQVWTIPGGSLLLAVAGSTLYTVTTSYVATSRGTLATSSGYVSIADNGLAAIICDGANRYSFNWTTNAFATLTDGAFNGGVRVDINDNFLIYNAQNSQQFAATTALSTATPGLSFSSNDGSSDNLVAVICANRELFCLSEVSSVAWIDAGLFPFPYQRIPGTSSQHGCLAAASVARLGDSFAWLARDSRGLAIVALMEGYKPVRISTHAVEQALAGYTTLTDAIAYGYQQGGHEFYVLTFPTADVTWCYDLATQLWHKRAWKDSLDVLHRHRSNCAAVFNGEIVVGDYANGNLYALSQSTYTDNGDLIPCIRRCPHITTDLKRQFFHDLQIQFQPGVGLQSGQGSNPQAMLTWSDDGGSTWSNQHWANIGKVGKYKNRAIWRRLGWARDRIFEVAVTDPVYRVIVSANLNASAGAH